MGIRRWRGRGRNARELVRLCGFGFGFERRLRMRRWGMFGLDAGLSSGI
jgi:hypothetical protein